jgi:Ca2+-binding RTX toxin-like protein
VNRVLLTVVLAAACGLGVTQPAAAVDVSGPYFDIFDKTGSNNDVTITQVSPDRIRVTDTAGVTFGSEGTRSTGECISESPQSALCVYQPADIFPPIFDMGQGDDSLTVVSFPFLVYVYGREGNDRLASPVPQAVTALPGAPLNRVQLDGGPGNDVLTGNAGPDSMKGRDGDDTCLDAAGGGDFCALGLGNDTCDLGPGGDYCNGARGSDTCIGGAGNDRCNGSRGRDRCNGGAGHDTAVRCERAHAFERVIR